MSPRPVVSRALGLGLGAVLLVAAATSPQAPWLLWNGTGSVPYGIYLRLDRPAARGDLVAACLPEDLARYGHERGYLLAGSRCPARTAPVLKRLAARSGAWIEIVEGSVSIDRASWPGSEVRTRDSAGRPIPSLVKFPYVVPVGQVLLLSEHPRSFDGRYFGPIPESQILGAYRPLLTWTKEASP